MSLNDNNRLPPIPPDLRAEWEVHQAQERITREELEARQYHAARARGLSPQEARDEVLQHRRRNEILRAGFDAAMADLEAGAGLTSTPLDHISEPDRSDRSDSVRDRRRREELTVIPPSVPGQFSRALSSGGAWLRALGVSLALGGGTFFVVAAALHWIFRTKTFLTWPTGIVAVWLGVSVFVGVLHAASREVREWIRFGGAKPIWRR